MLNNTPWAWNSRKSAANMTARTSNGIRIFQGKRAKGQSNPSPQYLQAQAAARALWPVFRAVGGFVRSLWTNVPVGRYVANMWYKYAYDNGLDLSSPPDVTVIWSALRFTSGVMTPSPIFTPVADVSDNKVNVNFAELPTDASQTTLDLSEYVIHNRTKGTWLSGEGQLRLDQAIGDIAVNPALQMTAGDVIDIYVGFRGDPTGTNAGTVSDSVYTTVVAVA